MPDLVSDPIILPYVTIQHDFENVIADVDNGLVENEDIWLSCYKNDAPSVHGKVRVTLGEQSRKVEMKARDGVGFERRVDGQKASFKYLLSVLSAKGTMNLGKLLR
jgi:hypothetical protein